MALKLRRLPGCGVNGMPVGLDGAGTGPAIWTQFDVQLWEMLAPLLRQFNLVATQKHAFGITVNSDKPVQIQWSPLRIASAFVPVSAPVYMGGDATVTVTPGSTGGYPIRVNQSWIYGPEEGGTPTWLIGNSQGIDVRCLELIPASS